MTISRPRLAGLIAVTAILVSAAPAAADEPVVDVSPSDAGEVLDSAQATVTPAQAPDDAEPAADATIALHDLATVLPDLSAGDRAQARDLLARPTDGPADALDDGFPPSAPIASAASAHFCVFWVNAPGYPDAPDLTDANGSADGDGVPDYVESLLGIAEYSYGIEVAPGPLGWQPPKPDTQGCGADPSARSDLYLKQLGSKGLFGYETVDPGQGRARSQYGYMVLDNDYAQSEYGYADPTIPASVTFAHEFNHLLQVRYDTFQDTWMLESTATWVEEKVYPDVNDYLGYIPAFARYPSAPITSTFPPSQTKSLKIYGSAVWNHWLDGGGGGFGADSIRRAWESSAKTDPPDFAVGAYDRSIARSGGKSFSREFVPFAAATAEWRAGAGEFPDHAAYPDVVRKGDLRKGSSKRFSLDHTAYRLLDVKPQGDRVVLHVNVEDGVRSGIALVGREGDPLTGAVKRKAMFLERGGGGKVTLMGARRFDRITAVVVNADGRVDGFSGTDWRYTRDHVRFEVSLGG